MASKRNEILTGLKTGLQTIAGMTADRVVIGVIRPDKAERDPKIMIWWRGDRGERKDGGKVHRIMTIIVGVLGKVDAGSATAQLLALSEIYDAVHAKLEALADTAIGTASGKAYYGMKETGSGIEPSGFDDNDTSFYVGCEWELHYERIRGSAS